MVERCKIDFEEILDCLTWLSTSPMLNSIQSDVRESLTQFVNLCRSEFTSKLNATEQDEKENQSAAEEIKERNFAMEKEYYRDIISIAKQLHVVLAYGKNKCD